MAGIRIDKLLWYLRLARTRSLAQTLVLEGHIRINGRRVERTAHPVAVGDVLVVPLRHGVLAIELITVPSRRGPAQEAQGCYRVLDESRPNPIAAQGTPTLGADF